MWTIETLLLPPLGIELISLAIRTNVINFTPRRHTLLGLQEIRVQSPPKTIIIFLKIRMSINSQETTICY